MRVAAPREAAGSRGVFVGLAVATLLVAAVTPGAAQDVRAILESASKRYAPVTSLCADFRQRRSVPLLSEEHDGQGRLCQSRPDRFAMRFTEPAGDVVVMDGTSVWLYWPSVDPVQVVKLPVSSSAGGFDLHREFLADPGSKYRATYEGTEVIAGKPTHRIRLVPRTPVSYAAATVWIDTGTPDLRQVRLEEENGSIRTITLENIRIGVAAPADWFTFVAPKGAQVIS